MKKKPDEISKEHLPGLKDKKISRKEALRKSGFIALSAATTLILLGSPNKAHATGSPASPPPWN
jgi:hypothetical protein